MGLPTDFAANLTGNDSSASGQVQVGLHSHAGAGADAAGELPRDRVPGWQRCHPEGWGVPALRDERAAHRHPAEAQRLGETLQVGGAARRLLNEKSTGHMSKNYHMSAPQAQGLSETAYVSVGVHAA